LYPDLHKSIKAFVGMAPVLYTGNLHSALIDTLDKIQGPEIAFTFLDAMLYFHEIYINHAA
jgi:hypothetical protein